jgi:hypothetical protein
VNRLIVLVVIIGSGVLAWKAGVLDSAIHALTPSTTSSAAVDPAVEASKCVEAMGNLKSVHVTIRGTLEFSDMGEVKLTGTGDLTNPHKETLSLQLELPRATYSINERIEGGHEYIQIPSQSQAWKDVTGDIKSQVAPEMDPISNLNLLRAARGSDNLGTITMDSIDVHDISASVDPSKYSDLLKSDPMSGFGAADQTALADENIQVEAWIAASDHYLHQVRIQMNGSHFTWDLTYQYSNFVTGGGTTTA